MSLLDDRREELMKKQICRFCLSTNDTISDINCEENQEKFTIPLLFQIMACVSIEVFTDDGMPTTICTQCSLLMDFCYRFKQMCKQSDNLLKQYPFTGVWPASLPLPTLPPALTKVVLPPKKTTEITIANDEQPRFRLAQRPIIVLRNDEVEDQTQYEISPSSSLSENSSNKQKPPNVLNSSNHENVDEFMIDVIETNYEEEDPALSEAPVSEEEDFTCEMEEEVWCQPIIEKPLSIVPPKLALIRKSAAPPDRVPRKRKRPKDVEERASINCERWLKDRPNLEISLTKDLHAEYLKKVVSKNIELQIGIGVLGKLRSKILKQKSL